MNKHLVSDALKFAAYRSSVRQARGWVESKARQKQGQALLKHIFLHHYDVNSVTVSKEMPCMEHCGHTAQEIVNLMDFSEPGRGKFGYNTVYRNYPRLMKMMPELDHTAYNKMIVGYRDPLQIMTHFGTTNSPWKPEFDEQIVSRFRGNFFSTEEVQNFMSLPKSSRTGMVNRWRSNPSISHMMDILDVWEVMSS